MATSSSGATVLTVTVDNTGSVKTTLGSAIQHPGKGTTPEASEDVVELSLQVKASNAIDSKTALLTVNIEDDSPHAVDVSQAISYPKVDSNVMLIVDVSGSISNEQLAIMKSTIANILEAYTKLGDVQVRLLTFGGGVQAHLRTWQSAATILDYITNVATGTIHNGDPGTSYNSAIFDAGGSYQNFGDQGYYTGVGAMAAWGHAGKITGDNVQNSLFFLSDGKPISGTDSFNSKIHTWQPFLEANQINAHAFGVSVPAAQHNAAKVALDQIAYNGATQTDTNAEFVTFDTLYKSLRAKMLPPTDGGVFLAGSYGDDVTLGFGADGGYMYEISHNGVTYKIDGTKVGTSTGDVWDNATKSWEISTVGGGTLKVDMDDGLYSYTPFPDDTAVIHDVFNYSMIDLDGDTASATLIFDTPKKYSDGLTINGGDKSDIIIGADMNDTFNGGAGNDLIIGGKGSDTLTGGAGQDAFVWHAGDAGVIGTPDEDTITDFSSEDKLYLSDLLTGATEATISNFVAYSEVGADVVLHVNTEGGASATNYNLKITLTGYASLTDSLESMIQSSNLIL